MKGIQHAIEVFVDVGVQPVGADWDDDGNQHRVRSPIAGGAVQKCCGRPSRRSRSTSCVGFVHRVGYSIGYSSGAPRLRHVHDVRFRLFMRPLRPRTSKLGGTVGASASSRQIDPQRVTPLTSKQICATIMIAPLSAFSQSMHSPVPVEHRPATAEVLGDVLAGVAWPFGLQPAGVRPPAARCC